MRKKTSFSALVEEMHFQKEQSMSINADGEGRPVGSPTLSEGSKEERSVD